MNYQRFENYKVQKNNKYTSDYKISSKQNPLVRALIITPLTSVILQLPQIMAIFTKRINARQTYDIFEPTNKVKISGGSEK